VPAGPEYALIREAMGEDFHISGGWENPQLFDALGRGIDAMVPEHGLARVLATVYRSYVSG
jgi:hypothetical protein